MIGGNVYAYLMSNWEDLDDHLRWLEPDDLNLECTGVSHLDCVSKVSSYSQLDVTPCRVPGIKPSNPTYRSGKGGNEAFTCLIICSKARSLVAKYQALFHAISQESC